jgi:hypothetical protein
MNPEEIIESIRSDSAEDADGAQLILDWWREGFREPKVTEKDNCIVAELPLKSIAFTPFAIQRERKRALYVYLDNIRGTSPFDVDGNWREFRRRLDGIPGAHWSETDERRFSSTKLSDFSNADTRNAFFELVRWSINEVTAAN